MGCLVLIAIAHTSAVGKDQYLVLNIIPGEEHRKIFEEVKRALGTEHPGSIHPGIGAIFSYLNEPRGQCRAHLLEFLSLAQEYDFPVVVQLDGEQWWDGRPDLWNWWDSTRPGYDPRNRWNVEWAGWGPDHAVKIAWRNWGRQIRVLPPPNLMSPRYREACHEEMRVLVPLVLQWWKDLPQQKKYLLIGIKLGWESSIGVNAFYYPKGNSLLNRPERKDPRRKLKAEQVPGRGVTAIGYASVVTAHLAEGGALQEAHLAEVVRRHLEDLCALASELGVPREKLFTHVGGWKDEELLYDAAVNRYSCPGWSFYKYAYDATKDRGVRRALRKSDAPYWAAAEWMLMEKKGERSWRTAIGHALQDPKCRYMCIYNWTGIKNIRGAIDAIKRTLR
jgi:hypothetical protein